jgi:transposase-like protein
MKRISKTEKIRKMLTEGKSVKDVAKKVGTSENYVYFVRWNAKKAEGKPAKKKTKTVKKPKKGDVIPVEAPQWSVVANSLAEDLRTKRAEEEAKLTQELDELLGGGGPEPGPEQFDLPLPNPLMTQVGGDYYKSMEIQPIEYIMANDLNFLEGCIVKRISRWRDKGGVEDLEKIKHEVDLLINAEKRSNPVLSATR